jgi:uncharacterized delta-60 repeat protein
MSYNPANYPIFDSDVLRGSLLMTFDNPNNDPNAFYTVSVNGALRDQQYLDTNNFFSTYLYVGDVVAVTIFGGEVSEYLNVTRTDYTTDVIDGDNGIRTINVTNVSGSDSVTFTATTVSTSYNFDYRISLGTLVPPSPTPTPSITATPTVTPTPTITPTNTVTPTNTITPTVTPSVTPYICFNSTTGFNHNVFDMTLTSDNKLYINGLFTTYNGLSANRLTKLNSDGSIDNSFDIGTGFTANPNFELPVPYIYRTTLQSNNKLIVMGKFIQYKSQNVNDIIRLETNGNLDTSFSSGIGFGFWPGYTNSGVPYTISIQSNGKMIISGDFSSYNGTFCNDIVRLNSDGSFDNTFNMGTGLNNVGYDSLIDSNDKFYLVGTFTTYNGTNSNYILRLNSDGSIDSSFNIGTGFNFFTRRILAQSDGKLIVIGNFTSYNGTSAKNIIRLNTDGTVDSSFNIGTGFVGFISSINILSDNKIIVAGGFTSYNGTSVKDIIKLNTDGSIDTSFISPTYGFVSDPPSNIITLLNQSIICAGFFTSFNNYIVGYIVELKPDGSINNCNPIIVSPTPTPSLTRTPTP